MGEVKRPTRDGPCEIGRGHTTMERRKFVIGAGALASGSAAAVGTGAFSSVEAERAFDVDITGDSNAYLGLESTSGYSVETDDTIEVIIDKLNNDASTEITDVFSIQNNGDRDVRVWLDLSNLPDSLNSSAFTGNDDPDSDMEAPAPPVTDNSGVELTPGSAVGVTLYFGGLGDAEISGDYDGDITIYAVSEDSDRFPDSGPDAVNFNGPTIGDDS